MMKRLVLAIMLMAVSSCIAFAEGFEKGQTYIGPMLGLAYDGFGIGGGVEHALDDNWAIGGELSYTTFTEKAGYRTYNYEWKYTFIGMWATGAYHFTIPKNRKLDPYLKAGLGYFNWDAEYSDNDNNRFSPLFSSGYTSGLGLAGAAGLRYFFKPTTAGRVQVGFPFYLAVGIDFAI